MQLTLYTAHCKGRKNNAVYPKKCIIKNSDDLSAAAAFDHVCAEYRNSHRSIDDFVSADCTVMDNDNDFSDNPEEWVYPKDYEKIFSDIAYAVVPSRNDMKEKDGKSARPRHHVYFPHECISDSETYKRLKESIACRYPFFDENAIDAARFIYGNSADDIIWHDGELTIDCVIDMQSDIKICGIPQGKRNSTMSRFAGRVVKRYGVTDRAYNIFLDESKKCSPPLEDDELNLIWSSACKFAKKVQNQQGYIPPDEYEFSVQSLKPDDYSDIGQAKIIAKEYGDELMYTAATDMLRYDGICWVESKQKSVGAVIEFLDLQLADALDEQQRALDNLVQAGVSKEDAIAGGKRFINELNEEQINLYEEYLSAKKYLAFVMKRRDMKYIASALQTLKPMVDVPVSELDSNPYLLNTPDCTYDLRKGISVSYEHTAEDKITKVTAVSPGEKGKELWLSAVNEFFSGDTELIGYVQQMMGLSLLGKVFVEALIIAYGEGGNGKSTFGNAILKTIGTYGGMISADALTVGCKRNVKPELAEAKGKRLLIAAELEEGMRLNTSMVKQLCSTDTIEAEKKYKDPFHFTPTHTVLLYTNHLPRVGAMDDGIWRRLIVIPFYAKIKPKKDIKNYGDYLFENAGEYILRWLIDGAERIIKNNFNIQLPKIVQEAVDKYKRDNDWLAHFLDACCEIGDELEEKSGNFYDAYRAFCARTGEYVRNSAEFYAAVEQRGIGRRKKTEGRFVTGVRLIESDFI